jgi:hypothetical protein
MIVNHGCSYETVTHIAVLVCSISDKKHCSTV